MVDGSQHIGEMPESFATRAIERLFAVVAQLSGFRLVGLLLRPAAAGAR